MNSLIDSDKPLLETLDPDLQTTLISRREALGRVTRLGAAATVPLALAVMAQDAHGRNIPKQLVDVLGFALMLERLEAEFYKTALDSPGLIPAAHREVFETIARHEKEHVALLATATVNVVNSDRFDFTGRGRYPDVFRNYRTFLTVAATFEDTGVRAYKGQAPNLMPVPALLSIALRIHSVEARHASKVRQLRGDKAWLTGSGGSLGGAFDQPMSTAQVVAAVRPFVIRGESLQ